MSQHLKFHRLCVDQTLARLQRDLKLQSHGQAGEIQSDAGLYDCHVTYIHEENLLVHGKYVRTYRIFVRCPDSGPYESVGWVLPIDIDYCMVCSTSFGIFTYKHICRACGNIVCSSCSPSSAMIQELSGPSAGNCGPQRVCSLCFWGQDAVFAVCYNLTHPKEKTSPQIENKAQHEVASSPNEKHPSKLTTGQFLQQSHKEQIVSKDEITVAQNEFVEATGMKLGKYIQQVSDGRPTPLNDPKDEKTPSKPMETSNSDKTSQIERSKVLAAKIAAVTFKSITPTPGLVLKTRRADGSKVFVNVATHPTVPYKHGKGADKVICMVCGDKRATQDLRGGAADVYDIIIHPDELQVALLDATGEQRKALFEQAIELLRTGGEPDDNQHQGEPVEGYATFKISSNYKSSGSAQEIAETLVPADTEIYYTKRQWKTSEYQKSKPEILAHHHHDNPIGNPVEGSKGEVDQASKPRLKSRRKSSLMNIMGAWSTESSVPYERDISLLMYLVPMKQVQPGQVLGPSDLSSFESFPVDEAIIQPSYGFTIMATEPDGREAYINVSHHPHIGSLLPGARETVVAPETSATSKKPFGRRQSVFLSYGHSTSAATTTPAPDVPPPSSANIPDVNIENYQTQPFIAIMDYLRFNYIIGNVNENCSSGRNFLVYDVHIPTAVILRCTKDADARQQVTDKIVDIIRRSFHRKLSSQTKYIYNYKSPEISHDSNSSAHIDPTSSVLSDGIEHRSEKSGPPPCWNVVERFRIKFAIAMVGTLWRRTRRNDSWKEITLLYMGTDMRFYSSPQAKEFEVSMDLRLLEATRCPMMKNDVHSNPTENIARNMFPLKIMSLTRFEISDNESIISRDKDPGSQIPAMSMSSNGDVSSGGVLSERILAATSEEDRDLLDDAMKCQSIHLNTTLHLVILLPRRCGWIVKQGHLVMSWHHRYVTIYQGVLCYFDRGPNNETFVSAARHNSISSLYYDVSKANAQRFNLIGNSRPHDGHGLKGLVVLYGASVSKPSVEDSGRFRVSTAFHGSKDFLFEAPTRDEALAWIHDIEKHIHFADTFPYLVNPTPTTK